MNIYIDKYDEKVDVDTEVVVFGVQEGDFLFFLNGQVGYVTEEVDALEGGERVFVCKFYDKSIKDLYAVPHRNLMFIGEEDLMTIISMSSR